MRNLTAVLKMDAYDYDSKPPRGTIKKSNHKPLSAPKVKKAPKLPAADPNVVSFKKKDGTVVSFARSKKL